MIFIIDKSIKECNEESLLLFAENLFRACLNKHFVVTLDYDVKRWIDTVILDSTTYLGDLSRQLLKQCNEFWSPTTMQKEHLTHVKIGVGDGMRSIEEMAKLVNEPSLIVLENGRYDWAVLQKWVELYRKDKSLGSIFGMVHEAISNLVLRDYNAGGCKNYENVLTVLIPTYGNIYSLKLVALFDSDKHSLNDSAKHTDLINFLDSKGIAYHELKKRKMENYFPLSTYQNADLVNQSKAIPDVDWDYIDLNNKQEAPFLHLKKEDLETLSAVLTKQELESRVETIDGMNEIKEIIILLAKYI
jgi:hypothetical protein